MISAIKGWFSASQFWIGVVVVVFFFGMAMSSRIELEQTKKKLTKAKSSLAVQQAENVGLKAAIESQNTAIDALSNQTASTLSALTIALAKAGEVKAIEDKKIEEVRNLPPASDCEVIRMRMINYAIQF